MKLSLNISSVGSECVDLFKINSGCILCIICCVHSLWIGVSDVFVSFTQDDHLSGKPGNVRHFSKN